MTADFFLDALRPYGVDHYFGVPDSLLAPLCDTLYARHGLGKRHRIAANEGGAVGLAAGHYLATGRPALVYLQNSGIGNIVNPVASLLHADVYGIPCVFAVGWRGQPGIADEPQHAFQGKITRELLALLDIECITLGGDMADGAWAEALARMGRALDARRCAAFIVEKGALTAEAKPSYGNGWTMRREEAIAAILRAGKPSDIFISTTGKTSRELFELREGRGEGHAADFLTVGSMGHALMIALGIAPEKPDRRVWCLDGDGALTMHMGGALLAARSGCENLRQVVINNGAHESVGGLPVAGGDVDFADIARALGYAFVRRAESAEELGRCLGEMEAAKGPVFLEICTAQGSRGDLGRPTTTPGQNMQVFMRNLGTEGDKA